jgi:hypothetical protein
MLDVAGSSVALKAIELAGEKQRASPLLLNELEKTCSLSLHFAACTMMTTSFWEHP